MMAVSGYLEILTTLIAWDLYETIWDVFTGTGVALVPVISIIWRNIRSAREKRDRMDVGIVALRLSEIQVYLAIFVVVVAVQPLVTINFNDVIYTTNSCEVAGEPRQQDKKILGNTGTGYDSLSTTTLFNGKEIHIPIWWAFINNLFRGMTAEMIAGIPCNLDVIGAKMTAENLGISDAPLRMEAVQFGQQCWIPARNMFYRDPPDLSGSDFENNHPMIDADINWIGSHILRKETDYYQRWQASKPVEAFPYKKSRDRLHQDPDYATYGYPRCDEWYDSLQDRVYASEQQQGNLSSGFQAWLDTVGDGLNYTSKEKAVYLMLKGEGINERARLSNNFSYNPGVSGAVSGTAQDMLAIAGLKFLSGGHYTKMRLLRDAMPMVQALLMLLIIIAIPIAMVFSEYDLKTVFILTFIQFGVIFWSFLFALAYWLDNNLASALVDPRFLMGNQDKVRHSLLMFISSTFHGVLPLIFTAVMTWAGVSVGTTIGDMAKGATQDAAAAGEKGVNKAESAATKGTG